MRRVGQSKADVRVIAATHRDLEREVNRGIFREDLYYRLAKVSVRVPALRDRPEDPPLLVESFIASLDSHGSAHWPGNLPELKNYVERSIVLDEAPSPSSRGGSGSRPVFKLNETIDDVVPRAGELCRGNMSKASRMARMDRMHLHQLAQKYGFSTTRRD